MLEDKRQPHRWSECLFIEIAIKRKKYRMKNQPNSNNKFFFCNLYININKIPFFFNSIAKSKGMLVKNETTFREANT